MTTKQEIDDLDDLDDLLDDFDEETPVVEPTVAPVTTNTLPTLGNDDFAKQLQNGMEDLLKELDTSPEAKADFEQLMAQMGAATIDTPAPVTSYPNSKKSKPKDFQANIEANLQRMRESESKAKEESPLDENETDAFMTEMMRQFQSSAGGDEGDFSKVLEGMMSQLMSKEILYEPLLELHSKYPDWIAAHPNDPKIKDYQQQDDIVKQILEKFDDSSYRDEDAAKKAEVMELMTKMQDLGSPPQEIMGEDMGMLDPSKMDSECSIM